MIITINNKKYDVTEFLNEHPGGKDVFIDGADMTEKFNKVGHSKEAIKMLEKYLIVDEKLARLSKAPVCEEAPLAFQLQFAYTPGFCCRDQFGT